MNLEKIFENLKNLMGKKIEGGILYFIIEKNLMIKYVPDEEIFIKLYLTYETIEIRKAKEELEIYYYGKKNEVKNTLARINPEALRIIEGLSKYENKEIKLSGKLKENEANILVQNLLRVFKEKNF